MNGRSVCSFDKQDCDTCAAIALLLCAEVTEGHHHKAQQSQHHVEAFAKGGLSKKLPDIFANLLRKSSEDICAACDAAMQTPRLHLDR